MNDEHESVVKMWNDFLKAKNLPLVQTIEYEAYSFCDDQASANELARLVKEGKKTSTSSLFYLYELEDEELPMENEYSIILNWEGIAQCIIRNTRVRILPFKSVSADYAKSEGEGDMSLEHWRKSHKEFFSEELKELNMEFTDEMKVVCEEFEVVMTSNE